MPEDTTIPQPEERHEPKQSKPTRRWHGFFGNLAILLIAPICAILLTMFVFQSYQVDGVSMQNTLQNKDRLIIWKGGRTFDHLFGKQYVPGRGDIVVVNQGDLSACEQTGKAIIKRVIGLPGEHVVYKNGQYTVYNAAHPHGFDPDTTLGYGKANTALLDDTGAATVDVTLSKTQLFVSGDHRADSCDSRYFGPVESNTIVGKLVMRIFPLSKAERF